MNNIKSSEAPVSSSFHFKRRRTWFVLVAVCICVAGIAIADSSSEPLDWSRQRTSYTFSSSQPRFDHMPPADSPARTVYDALGIAVLKDADGLSPLLSRETRPLAAAFIDGWHSRIERWKMEFMQTGVLEDKGWAYVVVGSHRPLLDQGVFSPFTAVVFLERIDDSWMITHQNLDPAERDNLIRRFDRLRHGISKAEVEQRREQSRREWFEATGRPFGVAPEDWDADAAYAKHKQTEAYLKHRQQQGTLAMSFEQMIDVYDGEYISPPVTFSITKEPDNPNFDNLLDAFQTTFYLVSLRRKGFPQEWGWSSQNHDDVRINGGMPDYLPLLYRPVQNLIFAWLSRVQILCRIPLEYNGVKYQKIHYRVVYSDDELTVRVGGRGSPERLIVSGYAYFKQEGTRWIPNKDLGGYDGFRKVYVSGRGADQSLSFLVPNQANMKRLSDVTEGFQNTSLPEHMRRLYSTGECIEIEDARKAGMWNDL